MNHAQIVGLCFLTIGLASCSGLVTKDTPAKFVSPTGKFECSAPSSSGDLKIDHRAGIEQETVSFVLPRGSTHSLDRLKKGAHEMAKLPMGQEASQRLAFAQKLYITEMLVPSFDLVEVLSARPSEAGGRPIRMVILNIENNQNSQHHGLMFFETEDHLNVMHYTHPLLWREDMIVSALLKFYNGCKFDNRRF